MNSLDETPGPDLTLDMIRDLVNEQLKYPPPNMLMLDPGIAAFIHRVAARWELQGAFSGWQNRVLYQDVEKRYGTWPGCTVAVYERVARYFNRQENRRKRRALRRKGWR